MIERLSRGPATVRGLTEPYGLSQQMISKHVAYLVRARIVVKTKVGRESVCRLRPEAITKVAECSACARVAERRKYFSHRAEKGFTGRMMSVVGAVS